MRKKVAFTTIMLIFLMSAATNVEAEETRQRFQKEQLSAIALAPVYYFHELVMHAGSHALAASIMGVHVDGVYPYPHRYDEQNRHERVDYTWPEDTSRGEVVAIFLAPYFTNVLMFTMTDILLTFHPTLKNMFIGAVTYIAGMITPFIDFIYNLYNPDLTCDFGVAAEWSGQPRTLFYTVGSVVAAVALWRIVQTGIRIFSE